MCLNSLNKLGRELPAYKERIGWKVFSDFHGVLTFQNFNFKASFKVPVNKWIESKRVMMVRTDTGELYTPRFHIYLELIPGEICTPVRWKGPVVVGKQNGFYVVVATKMFVKHDK